MMQSIIVVLILTAAAVILLRRLISLIKGNCYCCKGNKGKAENARCCGCRLKN